MDKLVKGLLRKCYHDIFYLMRNKMIFEENVEQLKDTIRILRQIEELAGEEPNTFFLEAKKAIKK